jgi:hypothetical protein
VNRLELALLWVLTEAAYRGTDHRYDGHARDVRRLADQITETVLLDRDGVYR